MSNINLSNFETGDNSFEDVYIYGKLIYSFENDEVTYSIEWLRGGVVEIDQTSTHITRRLIPTESAAW